MIHFGVGRVTQKPYTEQHTQKPQTKHPIPVPIQVQPPNRAIADIFEPP